MMYDTGKTSSPPVMLTAPNEICFVSSTFAVIRQTQNSVLKSMNSTLTCCFFVSISLFLKRLDKHSCLRFCSYGPLRFYGYKAVSQCQTLALYVNDRITLKPYNLITAYTLNLSVCKITAFSRISYNVQAYFSCPVITY